jgi:hypothetical protein
VRAQYSFISISFEIEPRVKYLISNATIMRPVALGYSKTTYRIFFSLPSDCVNCLLADNSKRLVFNSMMLMSISCPLLSIADPHTHTLSLSLSLSLVLCDLLTLLLMYNCCELVPSTQLY